ncbi:MAG: HlyD family efflux transporter periplasmic adaptor subunit [Muribaculaceae bacterium]|nr:HlyD family efflux transporter periplasmic adaptor subunit [Muribaculaceae bacterium]
MDREISKTERVASLRRSVLKYVAGAVVVAFASWGVFEWARTSVRLADLKITTVSRGDIETTVTASAKVAPAFEEIIVSPISSRIVEVYHRPGDEVEAGTPLLRLDIEGARTDYEKRLDALSMSRLQLEQLRGNIRTKLGDLAMRIKVSDMKVRRLEAELAGERYLDSIGSGTTDRVRESEFALNSERLSLEQLRQQYDNERSVSETDIRVKELDIEIGEKELAMLRRTLADAEIRAPRRGTVTEISDQIGQQIGAGTQMARLADLDHYKITADVPDGYASRISLGCRTHMKIKGTDVEGRVVNISPTSANGMISFVVVPDCDSLDVLRPGLKADIYVNSGLCADVLRIDNVPFYNQPGMYNLYVKRGDEIELRRVKLGAANYDFVEVVSGLQEGDEVVTNDMSRFKGVATIRIK